MVGSLLTKIKIKTWSIVFLFALFSIITQFLLYKTGLYDKNQDLFILSVVLISLFFAIIVFYILSYFKITTVRAIIGSFFTFIAFLLCQY